MAGVPISLLPQGTLPYTGTELFAFVQGGETRANDLQSFVSFYEDYFVTYDLLGSLSGNWQATYIALEVRGALWDANYSVTSNLSSNWNSVYSTVQTYSADWGSSNNFCGETVYLETVDPCAGTGDTITVNANLDIQGFSINNIGNSSLNFESGAKISSNANGGVLILPNPSNIPGKWGTAIGLNCSAPAAQSLASGKNTSAVSDMAMAHGLNNSASAPYSIAAGGQSNVIDPLGLNSAILGGKNNRLSVSDSTAMGTYAQSLSHAGSFVFADGSTTAAFTPVSANSFNIKASGGLRLIDGFESVGRVLTCDADGTGHWADPTGGGGGANVIVQSSPPSSANEGDLWFDDTSGVLYIYYDGVWVDASAGSVGTGDGDFCGATVLIDALSACSPSNTISLTGNLDLNGGSLLNVGNNSITFESGATISSDVGGNIIFSDTTLSNIDTLCATTIHATSSFTHYQDIIVSELSGFDVTGDVNVDGDVTATGNIATGSNSATGSNASAIGGGGLSATGDNSIALGGINSITLSPRTAVLGGQSSTAGMIDPLDSTRGQSAVTLGGSGLSATDNFSAVVGGINNIASGKRAGIIGGSNNVASGDDSEVLGGQNGKATATQSTAVGGNALSATGTGSLAAGGDANSSNGQYSAIIGGSGSVNDSNYSAIIGATNAVMSTGHNRSVILGGVGLSSFAANTVYVPSLDVNAGFKMPTGASAGYVLTSDADGVGTWQTIPVGGYDDSALQAASANWDNTYTTVDANSANWSVDALQIAASDETTDLTTGIVTTFRAPYAMELTDVRASVTTAPVGADITVDVTANGTTIFSTIVSIDDGDKTSVGSASPKVISTTSIPDDAELKVDIKTVGSTTAGTGLKLSFIGYKS